VTIGVVRAIVRKIAAGFFQANRLAVMDEVQAKRETASGASGIHARLHGWTGIRTSETATGSRLPQQTTRLNIRYRAVYERCGYCICIVGA
jgi:hypothetical protein